MRVYTGLNQKCPQPEWWGETSTEFAGAEDIHLEASLEAIRSAVAGIEDVLMESGGKRQKSVVYDLLGRKFSNHEKGILIKDRKKFFYK